MISVFKREGENSNSLVFRFGKRIKQSGILKEVRSRRFRKRQMNRRKRLAGALYRASKEEEFKTARKYGFEK